MNESDWDRLHDILDTKAPPSLVTLRRAFPGLAFVRCDASDMAGHRPFCVTPTADVFLIDGHGHCISLTPDPAAASGLLIAMRESS
ncbi:DUF6129 family protein [Acidiferrobacter sp.]|jgi:hypothetical protein|uniref:DUF6129 family protein n=1 Tax=Acidiferrobacter sp. TaxID=1872107 RepID=UPI002602341A|nr:DUF6129 family protein [Acidiferrobacter sp.]